jgi:hypothetical protein
MAEEDMGDMRMADIRGGAAAATAAAGGVSVSVGLGASVVVAAGSAGAAGGADSFFLLLRKPFNFCFNLLSASGAVETRTSVVALCGKGVQGDEAYKKAPWLVRMERYDEWIDARVQSSEAVGY